MLIYIFFNVFVAQYSVSYIADKIREAAELAQIKYHDNRFMKQMFLYMYESYKYTETDFCVNNVGVGSHSTWYFNS